MSEGQKWQVKQATTKLNQTSKLNAEWRVKRLRGGCLSFCEEQQPRVAASTAQGGGSH